MDLEILINVLAGVVAMLASSIVSSDLVRQLLRRILGKEEPPKSYSDRIRELMSNLINTTHEVDAILSEVTNVASDRETNLMRLETELSLLESREKEIQGRIDLLTQVPIAAAEHFFKLQNISETRSARRDYLLFGAGVLVSTVLAIIIQLVLP